MKFTFISPALPPKLDGIGDYTSRFTQELSRSHAVQILTATPDFEPLDGIAIRPVFDIASPLTTRGIVAPTVENQSDWVVVQYNPFSYGNRGWNPYLVPALRQIRQQLPHVRIAVMAHETFVPVNTPKFAVMASWQRPLFYRLGLNSDIVFLSIEPWTQWYQKWFPRIPVRHLAVGSNMPHIATPRAEARGRLGFDDETFVVGIFGTTHVSRPFSWVGNAVRRIAQVHPKTVVLYVGPHVEQMRAELGPGITLRADGAAAPDEVSRRFAAMDLHLAPYTDGVSTRRGAFMAGIQHGVASISTQHFHTDTVLSEQNGRAFLLSPSERPEEFVANVERLFRDANLRREIGAAGARLYAEKFDWKPLVREMCDYLETVSKR